MQLPPLTAERRRELGELLADEAGLRARFPKVAEYLTASAGMPGSGDDVADAGLELRVLHYATGGAAVSNNPYWEIVAPSTRIHEGRRVVGGAGATGNARLAFAQVALQEMYAYAIPSPETIAWIVEFCAGRPVAEVGAGRGYWAAQLAQAGLQVNPYDVQPPNTVDNISFPQAAGQVDVWHPVADSAEFRAAAAQQSERVLFLCWPPGWGNTMASEVLSTFQQVGGDRLIYIGEDRGGKTGDIAFFDALASGWELAAEDPSFVSWWGLSDKAQGWIRRDR